MTNKRIFAVILAGLVFLQGHAQESSALSFVSIDRNPATAAMGGAQAVSALYNPSAIPFSGSDAVFSYQMWAPKTFNSGNMNLLAAFKIGDKLGISVSGAYQMGQEYTLVNESGISGKTFRPSDMLGGIGVGFAFTENLSAGVSARFASSTVASGTSYSGFGADVFVLYPAGALSATAGVSSLGMKVKSGNESYALPTAAKAGVGYDMDLSENTLKLAADLSYFLLGGVEAAAGGEFGYKDMLFLRAGAQVGTGKAPLPTYVSLGAGFKYSGFHVDLCWLTANQAIGNTLMAGLGYRF